MWQVHVAKIERQSADWRPIREPHPKLPPVVLGDFNQDRDGSGWYGTQANLADRSALAEILWPEAPVDPGERPSHVVQMRCRPSPRGR
jgi:hypothetical protein